MQRVVPFDVEHYAIAVELDPRSRSIRATCSVRLWPKVSRLESVELDFADLTIDSVSDAHGRELTFERTAETLLVRLTEPVLAGDYAEVRVSYHGVPRLGLVFAAQRAGVATQVFTHHQPSDAHCWFPCIDDPSDRATTEIAVTMPRGWTSLAGGDRIESLALGERTRETWRMGFPHPPYLTSLVAGEFVVREDTSGGIPLSVLVARQPESEIGAELSGANPTSPSVLPLHDALRAADRILAWTGEMLTFFERLTGQPYPYSKYAQACVDNFPVGGMENASATTLTDTCLMDSWGEPDPSAIGLVAHEAAHQWFGDLVTCRDWSEVWLNEGFATYAAALYTEATRGVDAFQLEMRAVSEHYLARDVGANRRPIVWGRCRDALELFTSGHVYQGGAARLHCLRFVLGDEAFFRGVRTFVAENQGSAVTTADLRRAMERASGSDLRWFFEQWFQRAGFPELRVRSEYDAAQRSLRVRIEQVQGGEAYRLPLEIQWKCGADLHAERIEIAHGTAEFSFSCAQKPVWVVTDPLGWVPMRLDEERSAAAWQRLAVEAPWVLVRVDALRAVRRWIDDPRAAGSAAASLATLRAVACTDKVSALRALAWELLPPTPIVSAVDVATARQWDTAEADRGARASLMRWFARSWTDDDAAGRAALARRKADTWRGQAAALAWYASSMPAGEAGESFAPRTRFELLQQALAQPSWNGFGPALYLLELAQLDDPRALDVLLEWAGSSAVPDVARSAAVTGLGAIGRADVRARKLLVSLLATDRRRVRREVLVQLAAWRDPMLTGALRAFAATSVHPDERRVVLDALRATEDQP